MYIEKIKKRKFLVFLVIVMLLSFIFGCLFIAFLSKSNQELVKESINSYFVGIKNGNFQYLRSLYSVLSSNLLLVLFIWIMGISIIGMILAFLLLIYKSFMVGFSFTSILYTYGFKGLLTGIIYILPEVLNLFCIFIVVYYSINFSVLLFNHFFRKKDYNRMVIVKRYLKLLLGTICFVIVNSVIIVFVIPNLLKFF